MNITVFMSSMIGNNPHYLESALEFGRWMGENGHTMVFGGSREGIMEKMALAALQSGGKVVGVQTQYLNRKYGAVEGLTRLELTPRMAGRIKRMIELGDIFVIFPGGMGTLEEAATVMSMNKLGAMEKTICYYSLDGFYAGLKQLYERLNVDGLGDERNDRTTRFADTLNEIKAIINSAQK